MIKVLQSGFYTTIQDVGRMGYLNKGVPVSGAMDSMAASLANRLLENNLNDAVMEITMTGPRLEFTEETYICLSGAEMLVTINEQVIKNHKVYKIKAGDVLVYGKLKKGYRGYLAIKGGFLIPMFLGSRSYYNPITKEKMLLPKTEIPYQKQTNFTPKINAIRIQSNLFQNTIMVTQGPEFHLLSEEHLLCLFSKGFSIAKENNRMGYQIHENIKSLNYSMLTSATLPGTVQLTPSGKIIVLMKDGQTTGGYPRILQLTEEAISILAQKKQGDTIHFKLSISN